MADWYVAAVAPGGDKIKILDVTPCQSTGYVEAWMEAGLVKKASGAPCVIVIDGASARLWAEIT